MTRDEINQKLKYINNLESVLGDGDPTAIAHSSIIIELLLDIRDLLT